MSSLPIGKREAKNRCTRCDIEFPESLYSIACVLYLIGITVNSAFTALRTLIPTEPRDRKLSKIETLRLATSYISHLAAQLLAGPIDQPCLTTQFFDPSETFTHSSRHKVCTFCISHKKSKTVPNDNFNCQNIEGQVFFTNTSQNNSSLNSITYY